MNKKATSLIVSSLVFASVATNVFAHEKYTVSKPKVVTGGCVYAEKFTPDSCYHKLCKYLEQFKLPLLPGIDNDIFDNDANTNGNLPDNSVPDNNIPETNVPETEENTPENNIPDAENKDTFALEVLNLVNKERASNGLSALTLDPSLSAVAKKHSEDMKKNNYFSHTNLNGQSPFDRLRMAGISYTTAGENIAMGQRTPQQVVSGWMNSSGHRANILNKNFGKMGLGTATTNSGAYYWTQIFTN